MPLITQLDGARAPWLPGYRVKILDGNCIEASERRLKVLREVQAGALPGKSLVVYEAAHGLVSDVFPCEDGHAQERSLLGQVLETVQAHDLWIQDRNFCTCAFLCGLDSRGAGFITRQHEGLPFEVITTLRPVGRIETGQVAEQRVEVRDVHGEPHLFRRIRVKLDQATRDGARVLYILTNLPLRKASAKRVARLYRKRWTLEMCQPQYYHLGIFCWTRTASLISLGKLNVGNRLGKAQRDRLSVKPPLAVSLSYRLLTALFKAVEFSCIDNRDPFVALLMPPRLKFAALAPQM